ncbi:hypothetical protein EDEG_01933 [Edhazardia aedis USNM 41457]|uniref:Uncharacterized protein n=1 Tax=Edhazardia aedis (strain USNM 41457) TaxID=1003232 RepID=J9DR15_EDHAE|nr:hypothetical protein EDEG_01933 [Edhazardia aedis USNM 41457]|eukprot:EJW03777.1 hypothetical protein EDEG_01933 [Edhazardia aedis USNM 41457]
MKVIQMEYDNYYCGREISKNIARWINHHKRRNNHLSQYNSKHNFTFIIFLFHFCEINIENRVLRQKSSTYSYYILIFLLILNFNYLTYFTRNLNFIFYLCKSAQVTRLQK